MKISGAHIISIIEKQKDLLRPNQAKLSLPIIYRICRKMEVKLLFKPICVSSDGLIIDGHHRYISSLLTNFNLEKISNYPKPGVLNEFNWKTVEFLEEDWDSPFKIKMPNEEDAKYNGMNIEVLEVLLNKNN